MAAQHQHYVPKMLLRGFLSRQGDEAKKEQVRVFDLDEVRDYSTSIDNIMGERRYNDFWLDEDTFATVEPACGHIESHVAPLVERIRQERRLDCTPEERADLALLMAFQFIRTKRMRLLPERLNEQVKGHVVKMGFDPAKVKGLTDWDEDKLKAEHIKQQVDGLQTYADIIAKKVFFLMVAPEGSGFYLGDHPVVLHSDEPRKGMMGGLGLAVPYIQIYLPLSAEVLLCAYCPAVLGQLMKSRDEEMVKGHSMLLKALRDGKITAAQMKEYIGAAKSVDTTTPLIDTIRAGQPVMIGVDQVQCYNSLQAFQAHRFVVDPDGIFRVAKEMVADRKAADRADVGPEVGPTPR